MDLQKLIQLVSERPALWDRNHPDYHNRYKIQLVWMDVSNKLNERYEMVKARWRGLRDNYRKELSKVNDGNQSKWCHFESMSFLKEHTNKQSNENSQSFEQSDTIQSSDTQSNDGMGYEIIKLEPPEVEDDNGSKTYFTTSFGTINVTSDAMVVNGLNGKQNFDFIPVSCVPMTHTTQYITHSDQLNQTANSIELPTLIDISKNHVDMYTENFHEPVSGSVNYNNNNIVDEKNDYIKTSPQAHQSIPSSPSSLKTTFIPSNQPPLQQQQLPQPQTPPIPPPTPPIENTKKPAARKRPKVDDDVEKLLELEREKLEAFKAHSELESDDNYHFLMSLIPELKKIPSHRQLVTRIKIQELILEEQQKSLNENVS